MTILQPMYFLPYLLVLCRAAKATGERQGVTHDGAASNSRAQTPFTPQVNWNTQRKTTQGGQANSTHIGDSNPSPRSVKQEY